MKDRSTVICTREEKILLVARASATLSLRWSLPGGKVKVSETPLEAARRELKEETSVDLLRLDYLFLFGGLVKRHHVFFADLPIDAAPRACNEISRCEWFSPLEIASLPASIPTRAIVALYIRWHGSHAVRSDPSV